MAKVKAIPDGYHTVTPYLNIKGADKAIELYKKAFGAEELHRMPGPGGAIMHAEVRIGDSVVMLGEAMMQPPTSSSRELGVADADAAYKRAVDAGCKPEMPLANMFWGDRYGRLQDPFGNTWAVATHIEDVPPEEMAKRAAAAMAQMAQRQQQQQGEK
jgi:PhnB protein